MITGADIYLITLPSLAMLINNSSIYTSLQCTLAIVNAIANGNATTPTNYRQHYISYFTANNSITSPIMYLANSDFCIFGIILGSLLGYKK